MRFHESHRRQHGDTGVCDQDYFTCSATVSGVLITLGPATKPVVVVVTLVVIGASEVRERLVAVGQESMALSRALAKPRRDILAVRSRAVDQLAPSWIRNDGSPPFLWESSALCRILSPMLCRR
jgi:hypothetical protein